MMRTVQLEIIADSSAAAITSRLEAAGVARLPGYQDVPLRGAGGRPGTVVVTVMVPAGISLESLHDIPGVVRVARDVPVGPMAR
jgi:hypothetical protein